MLWRTHGRVGAHVTRLQECELVGRQQVRESRHRVVDAHTWPAVAVDGVAVQLLQGTIDVVDVVKYRLETGSPERAPARNATSQFGNERP